MTKTHRQILISIAFTLTASAALSPEERAKRLVVRVNSAIEDAAGVVFAKSGSTAFVMTAHHLISAQGSGRNLPLTVEFRTAPGELVQGVVENSDGALDLAVLRVSIPGRALDGVDFDNAGESDQLKQGDQVYPIGHPTRETGWYRPVQPVFIQGRRGSYVTFESLIGKTTGFSGGALFDSQWRLVGMIQRDAPPETIVLPLRNAMAALNRWSYRVAFQSPEAGPVPDTPVGQYADNVIYEAPPGWFRQKTPDKKIVLTNPQDPGMKIVIIPGKPLIGDFGEMFERSVHELNPVTLKGRVKTIRTDEGFNAKFVEGGLMIDVGGTTNPHPQPFQFLYMACDPVGRYESILYLAAEYAFEWGKPALNQFIESLDYRNSKESRERR